MSSACCSEDDAHIQTLRAGQARTLWCVLAINSVMFFVEFGAGWLAQSTALLADSLDMLGDSLVYALSLFVVNRSVGWKAASAGLKGSLMLGFGVLVLVEALWKLARGGTPDSLIMAAIGCAALAANAICLWLLTRHRESDVNMRSSWVCSRNDLIANAAVILAAVLVAVFGYAWPDIVIGLLIAALFLKSAVSVLRDARESYQSAASRSLSSD